MNSEFQKPYSEHAREEHERVFNGNTTPSLPSLKEDIETLDSFFEDDTLDYRGSEAWERIRKNLI